MRNKKILSAAVLALALALLLLLLFAGGGGRFASSSSSSSDGGISSTISAGEQASPSSSCTPGDSGETCSSPEAAVGEDEEEVDDDEFRNDDEFDYLDDDDDDDDEEEVDYDEVIELGEEDEFGSDMGVPQKLYDKKEGYSDPDLSGKISERILEARRYRKEEVLVLDVYKKARNICHNKDPSCAYWAVIGECEKNPGFMKSNCALFCGSCDQVHVSSRCPVDPDATDALQPGDLNRLFERILTDPHYRQYQPTVLSRPSYPQGEGPENTTYQLGMWLLQLENVATPEEAKHLIMLGAERGYERSADVGEEKPDGTYDDDVNEGRTSTNTWCQDSCYKDPAAQEIMDRMSNITGVAETNAEHLQLLRYEVGQYYRPHNDYIEYQLDRPVGVRILTFFLYLNDVEEGGETRFPRIGLQVKPATGRAVLWPSIFDDDPNMNDIRSDHEARPVIKGVKYGANAWIHMRDVKNNQDCL